MSKEKVYKVLESAKESALINQKILKINTTSQFQIQINFGVSMEKG